MINEWTLYWVLKLDSLQCGSFIFSLIFLSALIAFVIIGNNDRNIKLINIALYVFLPLFMVSFFGAWLVPSTKQMAMIYVIPKLVNSTSDEIPDKLKKMAIKDFSLIMKKDKNAK